MQRKQMIMSTENKEIVRRIYDEVWSQGRFETIDELYAPTFSMDDPLAPGVQGPDGYRQYAKGMFAVFPDLKIAVEEQVAEGNKVATRWRATGTHKGELMGIPPTGKQGSTTGLTITHLVDGKVVSETSEWNALGLLQQLGVIPSMEPAA
jgi:steroid delta-isomerase-like uncharacterized protein